jgi:16S rRNA (uracil1498-N3)-methyltransferase
MQRYFVKNDTIIENNVFISGSDFHHIKNVMRCSLGDLVEVVDEFGVLYSCEISGFKKDQADLTILKKQTPNKIRSKITIAQALIKKDRFELFLEKATELNVYEIIPTAFQRSIVKIDSNDESKKIIRYQSIVKEASEQSERLFLPLISSVKSLKAINYQQYDHVLVCFEREDISHHLNDVIKEIKVTDDVLVLIGPEGGISPEELKFLETKKARFVSLGSQILRSETASMYVLSSFLCEWKI